MYWEFGHADDENKQGKSKNLPKGCRNKQVIVYEKRPWSPKHKYINKTNLKEQMEHQTILKNQKL
jgi:hypothetical protein